MNELIEPRSLRAREARLGRAIGRAGYKVLLVVSGIALAGGLTLWLAASSRYGFLLMALAIICYMPASWWRRRLSVLPPDSQNLNGRLAGDVLSRLKPGTAQQPQAIWQTLADHWQAGFMLRHLLLTKEMVGNGLSTDPPDLQKALQIATQLADQNGSPLIEPAFVAAGLMLSSPAIQQILVQIKLQPSDVEAIANWIGRNVVNRPAKRNFGGIGRDWTFGFTPLLNRFGENISLGIVQHGVHFGWRTTSKGVLAMEAAFNNHTSAIALIGADGIGKSNSVYAFAERLIAGNSVPTLAYHQVTALSATDITARARGPGDLEHIMISLANEAAHASHVILFLDDAQLFFGGGPGTFDATQILLSIIQARSVPIVLAMTPQDYQRLKVQNQSLANLLTPVVLQEPSQDDVMRILEDVTISLENRHRVLIAYEALHEAYRLSGRYDQDTAYPGKAIKLLEQAVAHSDHSVVSARSVQQAIEQSRGVKVESAAPAEANALLHLEDNIHQRMINQTHAVHVVASALRRARAGVTNPKRPIGSFLFLGPTGVGKTELAKAVAATYFDSEEALLRLDMSEYQQPDDVQRLLSTGQHDNSSLLMSIRQQPFAVVLLDEIEKAHPNVLNLLLQLLDEGQLTDSSGKSASFKDAVIIATSNAGAQTIRERVSQGESLESFAGQLTDELINSSQFKPELLNRFDEIVLFRPLNPEELAQVVRLMLAEVNKTLANQNIGVDLTDAAIEKIVAAGNDPRLGARPMRRTLQRAVEDVVAQKILRGEAHPGDRILLDAGDLSL